MHGFLYGIDLYFFVLRVCCIYRAVIGVIGVGWMEMEDRPVEVVSRNFNRD